MRVWNSELTPRPGDWGEFDEHDAEVVEVYTVEKRVLIHVYDPNGDYGVILPFTTKLTRGLMEV
jgi:hypothetical protein